MPDSCDEEVPGLETRLSMAKLERGLFGMTPAVVRLGRFELGEELGRGAMGVVYRARDPTLDRVVAVKVLSRRHGAFDDEDDEPIERLQREARALAQLNHPHVVSVFDVGRDEGTPYVAMELVDGGSLADWCARRPTPSPHRTARLVTLFEEAVAGLMAAHEQGIIHRDIKPTNMLIGEQGRLRIADFGLARSSPVMPREGETYSVDDGLKIGEGTSVMAGTPAYMAPERYHGIADERSDQFALCVSFWEAFHDRRPFSQGRLSELRHVALEGRFEVGTGWAAPRWVRRLLVRGMASEPEDRFGSMAALHEALIRGRHADRRRRWGLRALGGVAVVAVVVVGSLGRDDEAGRCSMVPGSVAEAWSDSARALARNRFAQRVPDHGDALFEEIDPILTGYAERWSSGWTQACEATWGPGSQREEELDVRMLCLDRARGAFVSLTRTLGSEALDPRGVRAALSGVEALPPLDECETPAGLSRSAPLPNDPELRAQAVAIDGELAVLRARQFSMSSVERRQQLEALHERADAVGHAPLDIRVTRDLAEIHVVAREEEALALIEHALEVAQRAGIEGEVAGLAMDLHDLVLRIGRSSDTARLYLREAESFVERISDPTVREEMGANLAGAQALQLLAEGDNEQALERRRARLDYLRRTRSARDLDLIRGKLGVGAVLRRLSRFEEAEEILLSALEELRGVKHSASSELDALGMLMNLSYEQGKLEDARRYGTQMWPLFERYYGPEHPSMADLINNLAAIEVQLGDRDAALDDFRRALAIIERTAPDNDVRRVSTRINIAMSLSEGEERRRFIVDARDIALQHHGPESFSYANATSALAMTAHHEGDADEVVELARESLAVFDARGRVRRAVTDRAILSMALADLGELVEAQMQSDRALEDARTLYGEGGLKMATSWAAQAYVLRARGDRPAARRAIAKAEAVSNELRDNQSTKTLIRELRASLDGPSEPVGP